jgi:hypothetical protein
MSREDAYAAVQRNAMKVWESDGQLSLLKLLQLTKKLHPFYRQTRSRIGSIFIITSVRWIRSSPAFSDNARRGC